MTAVAANREPANTHLAIELEALFAACFEASEQTLLVGGADEPLYQPSMRQGEPHILYYRQDFFASALHEISHWCIAGKHRRQLRDFGYWYAPEGRDREQQRAFEAVEVGPQSLEWILSRAAGYAFRLSVDNLDAETGSIPDTRPFAEAVLARVGQLQGKGVPPRANLFFEALRRHYGTAEAFGEMVFSLDELISL